jgi:predicted RNA binding protein YcfA (HicA-like mRNA interferase family)
LIGLRLFSDDVDAGTTLKCIIHTMSSADIIRELQAAGWTLDRVRDSHHVFKHPNRPEHVVVPHPKQDLGTGLVAAIRKQAGL